MRIHEFGDQKNPVLLLLPGTACFWKTNFGEVIDLLAKDFFVAVVAYTGFDELDTESYRSVREETQKNRGVCHESLWRLYSSGVWFFVRRELCRSLGPPKEDKPKIRNNR